MKAFIVCVDYWDYLGLTLPCNRHHFEQVWIVTATRDEKTRHIADSNHCRVHLTDSFWKNGADFNKWAALEECLDISGRHGWICVMDADVVWPHHVDFSGLEAGNLYVPLRRNAVMARQIPPEQSWKGFPIYHPHQFAGYSQIFHASDEQCQQVPWYQTDWKHAGGADTFFEKRWPDDRKKRPAFECLHLGPPKQNWAGRVSRYLDASIDVNAESRKKKLLAYMESRRTNRQSNKKYKGERIESHE